MLEAIRCPNGHVHQPPHPRCPDCGERPTDRVDLADRIGTIVTWTSATATPPGVREPNSLAIVEFDLGTSEVVTTENEGSEGGTVRTIGGLTTREIAIGDRVRPVYVEELRDPEAGIREPTSQDWSGYRFEPI
ncbi:nucleic acid-binding protein [Halobacteriales archaeon QS_3_64_16]|nr:MAG: nucleic acid-binding protein [Halobacteriales archaeon QS_3_64_16]